MYNGTIHILHLVEGAKRARGLTVIIDVFRAFSVECYLMSFGASAVYAVGGIDEARVLSAALPGSVTVGERRGVRLPGFDFGNSPSQILPEAVKDRPVVHTTSAGTQGIVNAQGASEILTGSLVNASAIARYIEKTGPEEVSLVAMGVMGTEEAPEDELCASYIRSLLTGDGAFDIDGRIRYLQDHGGAKFFDPAQQEVFPEMDYWMSTDRDRFGFVLRAEREGNHFRMKKICVEGAGR